MTDQEKNMVLEVSESTHRVLANSYISYFIAFILGLGVHLFYPISIYKHEVVSYLGFVFIVLATLLIFWAQNTSRNLDVFNLNINIFRKGPYYFTRMPTHLGLFLLIIGFGLVINSFFVVLFTFIYFVLGKFSFIKKQEAILLKKYGEHYLEYKKIVRF